MPRQPPSISACRERGCLTICRYTSFIFEFNRWSPTFSASAVSFCWTFSKGGCTALSSGVLRPGTGRSRDFREDIAKRALQQIRDGFWDVVLVTPPCNTFSRVRFVQPGPKPVRSRLYPLGFPWLSDNLLELASQGNQFIHFSFQVCFATLDVHADFLLERPEDLGRTRSGHTPASIWQLDEAQRLFSHERVFTFAVCLSVQISGAVAQANPLHDDISGGKDHAFFWPA